MLVYLLTEAVDGGDVDHGDLLTPVCSVHHTLMGAQLEAQRSCNAYLQTSVPPLVWAVESDLSRKGVAGDADVLPLHEVWTAQSDVFMARIERKEVLP